MNKFLLFTIISFFINQTYADFDQNLTKKLGYGNYEMPVKINNQEQFVYIYSLLLDKEINAQTIPYTILKQDKFMELKVRCNTVGAMLSSYDFLKLNKEFTTTSMLESYENNSYLKSLITELNSSCKTITKK